MKVNQKSDINVAPQCSHVSFWTVSSVNIDYTRFIRITLDDRLSEISEEDIFSRLVSM